MINLQLVRYAVLGLYFLVPLSLLVPLNAVAQAPENNQGARESTGLRDTSIDDGRQILIDRRNARSRAKEAKRRAARERMRQRKIREGRLTPAERRALSKESFRKTNRPANPEPRKVARPQPSTTTPDGPLPNQKLRRLKPAPKKPVSRLQKVRNAWNKQKKPAGKGLSAIRTAGSVSSGVLAERKAAAKEDREFSLGRAAGETVTELTIDGNYNLGKQVAEEEIQKADSEGRSRAGAFVRALGRTGYEKAAGPYKSSKEAYLDEARQEMKDAAEEGREPSAVRVQARGAARSLGEVSGIAEIAENLTYDEQADRQAVRSGRLLQTKGNAKIEISLHRLWDLQDAFNKIKGSTSGLTSAARPRLESIANQYRAEYASTAGKIRRLEAKQLIDSNNSEYIALRQGFAVLPPELQLPQVQDEDLEEFLADSEDAFEEGLQEARSDAELDALRSEQRARNASRETDTLRRQTQRELARSRRNADHLGERLNSSFGRAADRDAARTRRPSSIGTTDIDDGTDWDAVYQRVDSASPGNNQQPGARPRDNRPAAGFSPPGGSTGTTQAAPPPTAPPSSGASSNGSAAPLRCPSGFTLVGSTCQGRKPGELGTTTVDPIQ